MKKYLLIILCLSLAFQGCDDSLERLPIDQLVEETAFRTVSDLEFGLAGALGGLNYFGILGHHSIFTDNTKIGVNNGGQQVNAHNQVLDANNSQRGIWTSHYNTINDFNRLIVAASTITPSPADQSRYDNLLGQCYAFRALAHYDLLLLFGLDVSDPNASAIPYVNFVSEDATPARNTTSEVVTGIQSDLTTAASLITGSDINFATQDFITFLRARLALETGSYTDAINFATTIINSYSLATPTQYLAMYNEDADTTEVIWKYDAVQGANPNYAFNWIFTGTGGGFIEMSNGLLNSFSGVDIRRSVCLDPASNLGIGEILIGKFPPNADAQYINDFKAMRVSEMYLLRAEAHIRNNSNYTAAASDVFAVRNVRYLTGAATITYNSDFDALTDILLERRWELAFEGHRYNDLKRMRSDLNTGIVRDPLDCPGGIPCSLSISDQRWVFPIPQAELNGNPSMTQAPGY